VKQGQGFRGLRVGGFQGENGMGNERKTYIRKAMRMRSKAKMMKLMTICQQKAMWRI